MATDVQTTTGGPKVPAIITQFRADLGKMESQFKMALPEHIPVERFCRVVMTAVQNSPKLLACDRQSFFNACMKAAADGLLPDGREGAIVPFGEDEDDQGGKRGDSSKATWMPMVAGLRKIARNSGEIDTWDVYLVYEGDQFAYELGDDPFIKHKPAPTGGLGRKITHAYSVAKLKDGGISRDVMNIDEIEDIRKKFSRSKKGPWSVRESYGEMCKKTVARRHSKVLPKSTDLDRVLHRDDDLYDFRGAAERSRQQPAAAVTRGGVAAALDYFGGGSAGEGESPGPTTSPPSTKSQGEGTGTPDAGAGERSESGPGDATEGKPQGGDLFQESQPQQGATGAPPPPTDPASYKEYAKRVIANTTGESLSRLEPWLVSDQQRDLRQKCKVAKADFDEVRAWVREALDKTAKKGA